MQEQANKTHYSWRTEPEIDFERQEFLRQRLAVQADIQGGVYPFKGGKLGRADVEWLLIVHVEGRGPIDWNDVKQRELWGLDLRGENVCQVELRRLALMRVR